MPVVLQSRYTGGGVGQALTNPITIGHLLLLWQSSRDFQGEEIAITGEGWIFLGACQNTTGFERAGAFYYKFAEATDESWDLPSVDRNYAIAETNATVLVPLVAATANTVGSSINMDCGGTVAPAEGDDILLIGGASVGASDTDYDTLLHPITPYADVTEEIEDWNGFSPLVWLGWSNDASASGTYVVGGTNARPRTYCGITLLIASEPPPVVVTPPLVCALDDADLSELVCIDTDDLINWSIRTELQGTGSGFIEIHRSHLVADTDVIKKGNWLAVKIPQIDDEAIFVFQMERITTTLISADEGGGETVKVAGRGNLSYFDRAAAMPRTWASGSGESALSVDGIINGPAATGNKAGQVLERAMREWQHVDRGVTDFGLRLEPIQHITHDFDYDNDSSSDPWDTTDMTGELSLGYVGEKGLVGILELIGTGAIDIVIWPTFLLQAFNHYGRDLTGGAFAADVVRFVRGVNIAEELVRDEGLVVDPTHTIVQGSDGTEVAWAFAESPIYTSQPHVEGHVSTFGTDLTALEAVGVAEMARRLRQGESIQFRVATPRFGTDPDPENGLYLPGPEGTNGNYWLGDDVTIHTGSGFRDYSDLSVRVMAITITSDQAGDLEVTVELKGTTLKGRLPPTTGSFGSFGGGGGSLGGSGSGGTGGSSAPPPPAGAGVATHVADPLNAHDASAISVVPFETIAATNVQAALEEMFDEIGAGAAVDVSVADSAGWFTGTNVETVLAELAAKAIGYQAHGSMGAAETFDAAIGWHSGTLNANCTLTLTGAPTGTVSSLFLELLQDGTGGRTITLPASVVNKAAIEAAQDTTLNGTTFLVLLSRDGGTTWYGGWWGQSSGGGDISLTDGTTTVDPMSDLTVVGVGATVEVTDDGGGAATLTVTVVGSEPEDDTQVWMPLTTVVGGDPELVWDGDDSLIPTLTPI